MIGLKNKASPQSLSFQILFIVFSERIHLFLYFYCLDKWRNPKLSLSMKKSSL